ncbi:hypothetical protein BC937DRAFT_90057 [Endogone sp. FLAS-F59071]|nr:hypothetical protein BC937DRAFT_90057 [Endogone sp. FLAS-F59071]|eukprot:RUS17376.1 hypothetical protein BC937DRAFT_90057 [Endogone sp. FLAS-F59071]
MAGYPQGPPTYDASRWNLYESRFCRIMDTILELQWVFEALPVHTAHHTEVQKKLAEEREQLNQLNKKTHAERKALDLLHRPSLQTISAHLSVNNPLRKRQSREHFYLEAINQSQQQEAVVAKVEKEMTKVETMQKNLLQQKAKLERYLEELHQFYDDMFAEPDAAAENTIERILHEELERLRRIVPETQQRLDKLLAAQHLMYLAQDAMDKAMRLLPGAKGYLDLQVYGGPMHTHSAEKKALESWQLVDKAHAVCPEVPIIPHEPWHPSYMTDSIVKTLTSLRGYRLKVQSVLRTILAPAVRQVEPELLQLKSELERKPFEWLEERVRCIERVLRAQGKLVGVEVEAQRRWLRNEVEAKGRRDVEVVLTAEARDRDTERDDLPIFVEEARARGTEKEELPAYEL